MIKTIIPDYKIITVNFEVIKDMLGIKGTLINAYVDDIDGYRNQEFKLKFIPKKRGKKK